MCSRYEQYSCRWNWQTFAGCCPTIMYHPRSPPAAHFIRMEFINIETIKWEQSETIAHCSLLYAISHLYLQHSVFFLLLQAHTTSSMGSALHLIFSSAYFLFLQIVPFLSVVLAFTILCASFPFLRSTAYNLISANDDCCLYLWLFCELGFSPLYFIIMSFHFFPLYFLFLFSSSFFIYYTSLE